MDLCPIATAASRTPSKPQGKIDPTGIMKSISEVIFINITPEIAVDGAYRSYDADTMVSDLLLQNDVLFIEFNIMIQYPSTMKTYRRRADQYK